MRSDVGALGVLDIVDTGCGLRDAVLLTSTYGLEWVRVTGSSGTQEVTTANMSGDSEAMGSSPTGGEAQLRGDLVTRAQPTVVQQVTAGFRPRHA